MRNFDDRAERLKVVPHGYKKIVDVCGSKWPRNLPVIAAAYMGMSDRRFRAEPRLASLIQLQFGVEIVDTIIHDIQYNTNNLLYLFRKLQAAKWEEEHKEGEEDEEELDFEFCNGFDYQCRKAYQIAKDHGWHEKPCNDGEVLALIHCEISEALQALRDGNKPDHHCPDFSSLEIELADAIIRIMDYAGERGLNLSLAILEKMKFNKKRPYKHGKNF